MTPGRRDQLLLACILLLAAVLRLVNLPGRGEWEDDQGRQLLDVMMWVRDGQVPLLGPVSSLGTSHHGVAFYVLLAPGAFLTDNNPVAAVAVMVVIGIAGVAATWWLGRTVGGPIAGHIAGLLMAVSPSAIQASTFVWNSNIVAPGAAVAVAAAWHAWRTERARWWILSAAGGVVMLNGHLSAVILAVPLAALLVADILRRSNQARRQMVGPICAAGLLVVIGFLPLLIHELRYDFAETRGIIAFVIGTAPSTGIPSPAGLPIAALPVIAWRVLVWPVSGMVSSAPLLGIPAAVVTFGALVISATGGAGIARQFGRWAAATVVWSVLALTLVSPNLAVIALGLPNDQYHTWLDPLLFAAVGVACARLAGARLAGAASQALRIAALVVVTACVGLSLLSMPPLTAPDGGWPAADATAERIHAIAGDRTIAVTGVAKSGAAIGFPLRRQHASVVAAEDAEILVVVCDPIFERAIGTPCGATAEDAVATQSGFHDARLQERFADGPRRVVSIYAK